LHATQPEGAPEIGDSATYSIRVVFVHLLALLIACLIIFSNNNTLLFVGYDGVYYRTIIKLQHEWMSRAAWFGYCPFQALGNTFFIVNTRLSPGYGIAATVGDGIADPVLAYTIVAFETFSGVLILGWALRLRPSVAFLGAWGMTLLALPFTFPVMLYPISGLCPHFIEYAAASCVLIGLFHRVGQHGRWISVGAAAAMAALSIWLFACSVGMALLIVPVLTVFILTSFVMASGSERKAKAWCVVALLAILLPTAVPNFLGNYLYSVPAFFGGELENVRMNLIWVSILFHDRVTGWFGMVLFVGAILGSAAGCFSRVAPLRYLARGTLAAATVLIAFGLFAVFGTPDYSGPAPLYFEFYFWPIYCLMLAYFVVVTLRALGSGLKYLGLTVAGPNRMVETLGRFQTFAFVLPCLALFGSFGDDGKSTYYRLSCFPPAEPELVQTLRDKAALSNGAVFRGSVATFVGYQQNHQSNVWAEVLTTDIQCIQKTHNDFRAIGLWYYEIPTLFEYNQFMTPTYYLLMTRTMNRPNDRQIRSVLVLTKPNLGMLQSLGVRFLLTDFPIADDRVSLVQDEVIEPSSALVLHLYELKNPNLATYSPSKMRIATSARDTIEALNHEEFDFTREAIADQPLPENLVPASSSEMRMCKDRMVVKAASSGTSVLLLPLQYSHCLELKTKVRAEGQEPRLVRLNLMQAGLVFSGSVHVDIRFANGPLRNPFGRLEDYWDLKRLNPSDVGPVR